MGRRPVPFTEDSIVRAIRAVKKAGIDIKTIRIEPDGLSDHQRRRRPSKKISTGNGYL